MVRYVDTSNGAFTQHPYNFFGDRYLILTDRYGLLDQEYCEHAPTTTLAIAEKKRVNAPLSWFLGLNFYVRNKIPLSLTPIGIF